VVKIASPGASRYVEEMRLTLLSPRGTMCHLRVLRGFVVIIFLTSAFGAPAGPGASVRFVNSSKNPIFPAARSAVFQPVVVEQRCLSRRPLPVRRLHGVTVGPEPGVGSPNRKTRGERTIIFL
jgi:hypothetical protein